MFTLKEGHGRLARPAASARQCRAARALLDWSQKQLAERSGVARKTIADHEAATRQLRYRTRVDITEAFERSGVEFIWSGGSGGEGVRLLQTAATQPFRSTVPSANGDATVPTPS
jgi:DNA-binding XRE family transcriptional regulator